MSYPDIRYHGESGEISAMYRPADQKPELTIGPGTAVRYLATGASTQGQFGLYRWDAKPHTPGPAAHFHRTMSESFFIISGTVRLYCVSPSHEAIAAAGPCTPRKSQMAPCPADGKMKTKRVHVWTDPGCSL